MIALHILAEQGQARFLESVEVLQTIVNILFLMHHQQGSSETSHLLYALGTSLSSDAPKLVREQTGEGDLMTRRSLRCQIERMSW
jgi:hypothetical protein